MEKAKVYYTSLRCNNGDSRLAKLERLIRAAGIGTIDFSNKFTAIKMHFGESGNLSFIRPNYVYTVASVIKELGGRPFLTDCNTLYVGGRKQALDHLETAYRNGFLPYTTGCHILIADGLKGTDETLVPLEAMEYIQEAKVGRALMDADILISLTHFKGHEETGFGGALKNIGMGGGSRAGKMEMHCDGKPEVEKSICIGCGNCIDICAHDAPKITNGVSAIDHDKCVGCGRCLAVCPVDAIYNSDNSSSDKLCCKIAEYTYAICHDRPCFHISLVIEVSPDCDCHSENDLAIVPDVGFFASFDPVALDMACADAVNKMPANAHSKLGQVHRHELDNLTANHPKTNWRVTLEHAQKIGLGTTAYELIEVK